MKLDDPLGLLVLNGNLVAVECLPKAQRPPLLPAQMHNRRRPRHSTAARSQTESIARRVWRFAWRRAALLHATRRHRTVATPRLDHPWSDGCAHCAEAALPDHQGRQALHEIIAPNPSQRSAGQPTLHMATRSRLLDVLIHGLERCNSRHQGPGTLSLQLKQHQRH